MRTALLVILAMGLLAAPAQAYPGERPAGPEVTGPVTVAENFWHARGVQPCPAPVVTYADDLDGAAGRALDCHVWILISHAPTGPFISREDRQLAFRDFCAVLVHELGHTAGLGHTETGIMAVDGPSTAPPWDCVAAYRIKPRSRIVRKRARWASKTRRADARNGLGP